MFGVGKAVGPSPSDPTKNTTYFVAKFDVCVDQADVNQNVGTKRSKCKTFIDYQMCDWNAMFKLLFSLIYYYGNNFLVTITYSQIIIRTYKNNLQKSRYFIGEDFSGGKINT